MSSVNINDNINGDSEEVEKACENVMKKSLDFGIKFIGSYNFEKFNGEGNKVKQFPEQFDPYREQWTEKELWANIGNNLTGKALNWFKGGKGK